MPINFPPTPVYPDAIDSDRTLFKVYNTTESVITSDNQPWSDEIEIRPVSADKAEIWADNGWATISGELLYYDDVEKNANGKVVKLKNCIRSLGGEPTQYNVAGTDIRSFVIGETHTQLADAIIIIERFLGTEDCDNTDTLNCCIDELDVPDCEDDGGCPSVQFDFQVVSEDTCEGTVINYQVNIDGNFNNFRLDFGDDTFTTIPSDGTKRYPPGTTIDPVVTVRNTLCEIVVTGVERTEDDEPERDPPEELLLLPIPPINIPTFDPPVFDLPLPDISIPPLTMGCIDLEPIDISIGPISIGDIDIQIPPMISVVVPNISPISLIVPNLSPISLIGPNLSPISLIGPSLSPISLIVPEINPISLIVPNISVIPPSFPTVISIIPPTFPTVISIIPPSITNIISFTPISIPAFITISPVDIPSIISVIDSIPTIINVIDTIPICIYVIDDIPEEIYVIDDIPSEIIVTGDIQVEVPSIDPIQVDWGTPPVLSCVVSLACPSACSGSPAMAMRGMAAEEALDGIPLAQMNVDYEFAGIPSKIVIEPPDIPAIKFDASSLPSKIVVESPDLPKSIKLEGAEKIPSSIKIEVPDELPSIKIDFTALPSVIDVDWGEVPTSIKVDASEMPTTITVEHDIPTVISVEGMVDTISVVGIPEFLPIRFENPEDLVFRVEPAEVKITLDIDKLITQDESGQHCFALVPCKV